MQTRSLVVQGGRAAPVRQAAALRNTVYVVPARKGLQPNMGSPQEREGRVRFVEGEATDADVRARESPLLEIETGS